MINAIQLFLNKTWKINLVLLLFSFCIYAFYFHHIFLNLNALLSSITGDSLKNYYTFAYAIKNDSGLLHFEGMNYPYGEHVVYTDCQPLLTFVLRCLPFTHGYVIGILHFLIYASFIVTPLILNKILRLLEVDVFSSFFISLAITLLSPQFAKINGGHHGLAYGCLVPISILLILNFIKEECRSNVYKLSIYNFLLFLLHPYIGFCVSLFCFVTLFIMWMYGFKRQTFFKSAIRVFMVGILPIIVFKIFMLLTDLHKFRTTEPYGNEVLVENLSSILAPDFGPFQKFLEGLFPNKAFHFEGHSYLGLFTIFLSFVFILSIPFLFKKLVVKRELVALLISAVVLLLISFGLHNSLLRLLNIKISSISQFRATCRFALIFYYVLPLFLTGVFYHTFKFYFQKERTLFVFRLGALLFFAFNLLEANAFLTKDSWAFWKFRNFFNEDFLNADEKRNIAYIKSFSPQAIIPIPIAMVGSEIYDRIGGDNSMIPGMIYSYHTNTPLISSWLSRTSIIETANVIQLLNIYKKENPAIGLLDEKDFLTIKTLDYCLPGETRLLKKVNAFYRNDSLEIGRLSKKDLFKRKQGDSLLELPFNQNTDTNNLLFIHWENRMPFLDANFKKNEIIYTLIPNKFSPGKYVVSFYFHYSEMTYKSLACNLLITKRTGKEFIWKYYIPMAVLSGFYAGYGVFEYTIEIEANSEYQFVIYGGLDRTYKISDFMLRPEAQDCFFINTNRDTVFNNYAR